MKKKKGNSYKCLIFVIFWKMYCHSNVFLYEQYLKNYLKNVERKILIGKIYSKQRAVTQKL